MGEPLTPDLRELRDRYAGQVMLTLIPICVCDTDDEGLPIQDYPKHIAELAYAHADAMLAARGEQ